ncbi:hypothetical protein BGZ81_002705 [Podila clonocystis]|nr:hypothetical protein BGZ81_002705 [Podila clonocystis]
MVTALDMSLDDIIKTQKTTNRPRGGSSFRGTGRGNSRSGPTRNTRQGRDNRPYTAGVQQYRATPAAPLNIAAIRESVPDGSKMQVSNLDSRVSADDLKLVFSSRVGPLKKCTLMYDQHGKSTGTAIVHFSRVGDAAIAYQKFNTVPLDGRPMRIEIVLAPATAQAVLPQQRQAPRAPASHHHNTHNTHSNRPHRGGRGGSSRGRGSHHNKGPAKTAEQLDAEMSEYMQVDS